MNIGCIIMASGFSRRFGQNKLLVPFHSKPLICGILSITSDFFAGRVVVTRYSEVVDIAQSFHAEAILHQNPEQRDTIRLGLTRLGSTMDGYLFCTADQPLLRKQTLFSMLEEFERYPDCIIRAAWQGNGASPVLFPAWVFEELCSLPSGGSGKNIISRYPEKIRLVEVSFPEELDDADTPEALSELEAKERAMKIREIR